MSTNHTPNYNLSQWEESDAVLRADFNEDNAKLDAALTLKGNCSMASKFYNGTGKSGAGYPSFENFDFAPRFLVIADRADGKFFFYIDGAETAYNPYAPSSPVHFSRRFFRDSLNRPMYRVEWYSDTPEHQFNVIGHKYSIIGFYNPD